MKSFAGGQPFAEMLRRRTCRLLESPINFKPVFTFPSVNRGKLAIADAINQKISIFLVFLLSVFQLLWLFIGRILR
ncbi:MAG: hypothetical protein LBT09_08670 [Planctomycetaceae bacterium]|nr:hypothetical protein [Planctomycetaceae bacterium]